MSLFRVILFLCVFTGTVLAQSTSGMMAGSFLRTGISGRTKAMGNAGTAIAGGATAAFDNPAFLPLVAGRNVGLTMHRLSLDRKFTQLALSAPLKGDAGISLWWLNAGVDNIDSRDLDGNQLKSLSYYDNAFALGFAISPVPKKVTVGLNLKVLYGLFPRIRDDNKDIKGTGIAFDIGTRVALPYNLTVAAVVKDLGGKYSWNSDGYWSQGTTKTDVFPAQFRLGLQHTFQEFTTAIDGEITKGRQVLHFGAEYRMYETAEYGIALRGGVDGDKPTFGTGFRWLLMKYTTQLDYAYIVEKIAPEDTHVLTWTVVL